MQIKSRLLFLFVTVFLIMPFFVFVTTSNAFADVLGQTNQFFIDTKYDESGRNSISATLRYVSDKAYFYIEDGFYNRISQTARDNISLWLNNLSTEFDTRIYPIETNFWGQEYNPGVDNDSKITILLSPLIETAGGYFDTGNENQKSKDPDSNQREMIYLNVNILNNTKRIASFLSHEFQHLISFNQKEILENINDDVWLNELRSEYSTSILGYNDSFVDSNLQRRLRSFLDFPSDSLTEWKNQAGDYGVISIFGEYLAEHYGSSVLVDSLRSSRVGIESLDDALLKNNYQTNFEEVFRNWSIANILNDITLNTNYGYFKEGLRQNLRVQPTKTFTNLDDLTSFVYNSQIKDWQAKWFWISGFSQGQKPVLEVSFSGEDLASTKVIFIIFTNDGKKQIQLADLSRQSKFYLDKIANIEKMIFIPYKTNKIKNFTNDELSSNFSFIVQRIDQLPSELSQNILSSPTPTPTSYFDYVQYKSPQVTPTPTIKLAPRFSNGALLRARGDIKVYTIINSESGGWRRHIVDGRIFGFYGLSFKNVIEVDREVLDNYKESSLIRLSQDKKVYEVDKINFKHWLDMSGESFLAYGRKFESVFLINKNEFNFYKIGLSYKK